MLRLELIQMQGFFGENSYFSIQDIWNVFEKVDIDIMERVE